jgi:hypothetical protein
MTDDTGDARTLDQALEEALARSLGAAGRVALVGPAEAVSRLAAARPDRYVAGRASRGGSGSWAVVALGADEAFLAEARETARELGERGLFVLVERGADGAAGGLSPLSAELRERLRAGGLALAGAERVLFERPPAEALRASTRSERLDAETRSLLLRCVLADDPGAVAELEEAVASLQRRVDVLAQLAVEHARTREAERERAERLAELERMFEAEALPVAEELERLRSEVEGIQSTRLWRVGQRWWRLRARARRALGRGAP